jgi:biotin transporter BioY
MTNQEDDMEGAIWIVAWLVCAFVTGWVADSKGHNAFEWVGLAAVTFVLGLGLAIFYLETKEETDE